MMVSDVHFVARKRSRKYTERRRGRIVNVEQAMLILMVTLIQIWLWSWVFRDSVQQRNNCSHC